MDRCLARSGLSPDTIRPPAATAGSQLPCGCSPLTQRSAQLRASRLRGPGGVTVCNSISLTHPAQSCVLSVRARSSRSVRSQAAEGIIHRDCPWGLSIGIVRARADQRARAEPIRFDDGPRPQEGPPPRNSKPAHHQLLQRTKADNLIRGPPGGRRRSTPPAPRTTC